LGEKSLLTLTCCEITRALLLLLLAKIKGCRNDDGDGDDERFWLSEVREGKKPRRRVEDMVGLQQLAIQDMTEATHW